MHTEISKSQALQLSGIRSIIEYIKRWGLTGSKQLRTYHRGRQPLCTHVSTNHMPLTRLCSARHMRHIPPSKATTQQIRRASSPAQPKGGTAQPLLLSNHEQCCMSYLGILMQMLLVAFSDYRCLCLFLWQESDNKWATQLRSICME